MFIAVPLVKLQDHGFGCALAKTIQCNNPKVSRNPGYQLAREITTVAKVDICNMN